MREAGWRNEESAERFAVVGLLLAMAVAAALLIWESRGLTILVDEWSWGFGGRTDLDLHAFVDPHNGHFVAVLVLITKGALQLFGADVAVPLRLLAVSLHIATAGCLFLLMRQSIGSLWALLPTVLVLFLGAANDGIIGSHGMSVTITVLVGLAAWLALQRRSPAWDALAAVLLTVGVATESTVLPFVFGAAAIIALDKPESRSRYWVVALPLLVYALWWLAWGHAEESDVAIANVAALPSFVFDSLAASLAAITGTFTVTGSRIAGFDPGAGRALAGGLLAVLLALYLYRRYRPGVASLAALAALLTFWLMTSGVASPARVPWSSRYLYISVILLLLVIAQEIGTSSHKRQAAIVLSAICLFALPANIREITYAADGVRIQAETNRAVMGAAELLGDSGSQAAILEDPAEALGGQVTDLLFSRETYAASAGRFDAPAFSAAQIEAAGPMAQGAADRLIARALPIEIVPASRPPRPLLVATPEQTGGALERVGGCLRFVPLAAGAQVSLRLPAGGLWVRPAPGPPVPIGIGRFDPTLTLSRGEAVGGRPSLLTLPPSRASHGWRAQLAPSQPLLVCAS